MIKFRPWDPLSGSGCARCATARHPDQSTADANVRLSLGDGIHRYSFATYDVLGSDSDARLSGNGEMHGGWFATSRLFRC